MAVVIVSPPPPTLPSMFPSTDSSHISVKGAWKGGPWLGCGDLAAMGDDSRGWLTTVEGTAYTRHPHSFYYFVVNSFSSSIKISVFFLLLASVYE